MGQVKKKTRDPIPKLQADLAKVKKQLAGKSPVTLLADSVTTSTIAANAVTTVEIAANTIQAGDIQASTITTTEIAANTITAGDIAAATITSTEIAAGTITATNIAAGTITATQIAAGTITATNIAAGTITSTQIQAGSINSDRLYSGVVQAQLIQTVHLAAGSITASVIAANTITATQLAASSVTTVVLAADSVTSAKIAANTIVAADIAANTITAAQITAGTITATEIASATIISANIAAGTITATNIAAGTITSTLLASNSVTSAAIVSGAVTSTKISVSQLSAIAADLGTITAGTVTGATLRTASSGKRVLIDTTGITGYGGTGSTVVFNFDTTTGNLTLTGVVTASAGSVVPATVIDASGGGIVSSQITDATIVGADIAANTVAANNIVAATITATELATDSVTSVKILAATIVAGDIASGTITATQIQAGSITADRMSVSQLSAIAADLGTITAGTITGGTFRTASSGDRMEMAGSGATGYVKAVVSGVDVVKLDPTNGLTLSPYSTGTVPVQNRINFVHATQGTFTQIQSYYLTGGSDSHTEILNVKDYISTGGGSATNPSSALKFETSSLVGNFATLSTSAYDGTTRMGASIFAKSTLSDSIVVVESTGPALTKKTTTLIDKNGDMTVARNITLAGSIAGATSITASGTITVNGSLAGQTVPGIPFTAGNANGTNPFATTQGGGGSINWNFSGGSRDIDFWNNDWAATSAFRFYQATAATARTNVAEMKSNGDFIVTGSIFAGAAGPTRQTTYYIYTDTVTPKILTNATGGFGAVSDAKLKDNVRTIPSALDKVLRLRGVEFTWKERGQRGVGLIAQEVAAVFPEVAARSLDADGKDYTWNLSHGNLVGPLVEAVRELDQHDARIQRSVDSFGDLLRGFAADVAETIGGQKGKQLADRFSELDRLLATFA